MCVEVSGALGIPISTKQLRRILKKLGYSWKRFRKSLKSKQSPEEYAAKAKELEELLRLNKSGYIDLFFADESGFNMSAYVPYGWQPKGEYIKITPSKTPALQVFGLLSLDNCFEGYSYTGRANSAMVIAFLDDFVQQITKPTVVVLDNAPIHKSEAVKAKIEAWKEEDLYIFFLPSYSPHLNSIEILWRKMKYEWIEYENIKNQKELEEVIHNILSKLGKEYFIQFT
jgi:transposase